MPFFVAKRAWSPRLRALLLSLLILLSFWLRLVNLDTFSMWTDEGLTTLRSGYPIAEILSNRIVIQEGVTNDTHPPFYYLILHFSRKLLGLSDFAFRFPSLLAGILLVPLLFQFGRRMVGTGTGLVAAALAAINPLQAWYANEARMYTIMVLLAALASYALWRAVSGHNPRRNLFYYVGLASLSFYTHYTAAFLIAGQMVFGVVLLGRKHRRLALGMIAAAIVVAIPLIPYTIPRLFTGAETAYTYIPPLVMLTDVIYAFSLGLTVAVSPISTTLAVGTLGLLVGGVCALRRDRQQLAFLLIYTYAAVFGLMAGSLIKPMYLGVRHIMIGSPAFLLLVARGFTFAGAKAVAPRRPLKAVVWTIVTTAGIAIFMLGSFFALRNLYQDPGFEKSDFRSLIRYVEERAGSNDVILYNDAILLAMQEHYGARPDVAMMALPIYPYPGETSLPRLDTLADEYKRIWFVTSPPTDGRDRDRVVRSWLDKNLIIADERNFPGRSTEVRVLAYVTAPALVQVIPDGAIPSSIEWNGLPRLEGLQLDFEQPATLPTLWVDLFWHGGIAPSIDTVMHFSLRGEEGKEWLYGDQLLSQGTTDRWQEDHLVRQSIYLPVPVGTPPGEYSLYLQPFSGAQETALGEVFQLTKISLAATSSWPITPAWPESDAPTVRFDNGLTLLAFSLADEEARPGHPLPISLYWRAERSLSLSNVTYQLDLIGPDGTLLRSQTASPGVAWLTEWPAGIIIKENVGIPFSPRAEAGVYRLRWRLFHAGESIAGRPLWRPWSSGSLILGKIRVVSWPLATELPDAGTVVMAQFGSSIQLFGYDLDDSKAGSVDLTLYWQALAIPTENYNVFVHLVSADGEIVSQLDKVPANWLRPTLGWRVNEVITDNYLLNIPSDLAAGAYKLVVGLYIPDALVRLPIDYQGELQDDDQLLLSIINMP